MKMHKQLNVKNNLSIYFILLFFFIFLLESCNSTYTSKKKGYYKIDLPERQYVKFDKPGFPYTFEYPVYATIDEDTLLLRSEGKWPLFNKHRFPFIEWQNLFNL